MIIIMEFKWKWKLIYHFMPVIDWDMLFLRYIIHHISLIISITPHKSLQSIFDCAGNMDKPKYVSCLSKYKTSYYSIFTNQMKLMCETCFVGRDKNVVRIFK